MAAGESNSHDDTYELDLDAQVDRVPDAMENSDEEDGLLDSASVSMDAPTLLTLAQQVDALRIEQSGIRRAIDDLTARVDDGFAAIANALDGMQHSRVAAGSPASDSVSRSPGDRARSGTMRAGASFASRSGFSLGSADPADSMRRVTLWCGTWNVGAVEPLREEEGEVGGSSGENLSAPLSALAAFAPRGFDVYALGVQEGISDRVFELFARATGTVRLHLSGERGVSSDEEARDKVLGRGDGSLVGLKFTGLALFVRPEVQGDVQLMAVDRLSFGATEGSKGAVGAVVRIHGATVAFISTHMASKKVAARLQQFRDVQKVLGARLGNEFLHLSEQFHHVVWMGDLNYRCMHTKVTAEAALAMIADPARLHSELLAEHDDLLWHRRETNIFYDFVEPEMSPELFPTYKKFEGRKPADYSDPKWPESVFRTLFKEALYKGGRTVGRPPGWCDRILYHSGPSHRGSLEVLSEMDALEAIGSDLLSTEGSSYRSDNDLLTCSDHSPVRVILSLRAPQLQVPTSAPSAISARPLSVVLRVDKVEIQGAGKVTVPLILKLLCPSPYEDGNSDAAKAGRGERRRSDATGPSAAVSFTLADPAALPRLTFCLKANVDRKLKGHCAAPLRNLVNRISDKGEASTSYFETLTCEGLPLTDGTGHPFHVQFEAHLQVRSL